MEYEAQGLDVWFDHRIFAKCTRYEDARQIARALNGKPVTKKKKVRKKHG
jgi:hypothetical protein